MFDLQQSGFVSVQLFLDRIIHVLL